MEARDKREINTNVVDGDLALNNTAEDVVPVQTFTKTSNGKIWIDRKKMLKQDRSYWYMRRAQDIVLSLLALIVLCVPMLIVALVIWIDSAGVGPFFTQKRAGRNGKTFDFIKFRSMVPQAEARLDELLMRNKMNGQSSKSETILGSRAWDGSCARPVSMSFPNCSTS